MYSFQLSPGRSDGFRTSATDENPMMWRSSFGKVDRIRESSARVTFFAARKQPRKSIDRETSTRIAVADCVTSSVR